MTMRLCEVSKTIHQLDMATQDKCLFREKSMMFHQRGIDLKVPKTPSLLETCMARRAKSDAL